jgi:hypothetical protein
MQQQESRTTIHHTHVLAAPHTHTITNRITPLPQCFTCFRCLTHTHFPRSSSMAFKGERHTRKVPIQQQHQQSAAVAISSLATTFIRKDYIVREGRAHALVTIFFGRHRGFLCRGADSLWRSDDLLKRDLFGLISQRKHLSTLRMFVWHDGDGWMLWPLSQPGLIRALRREMLATFFSRLQKMKWLFLFLKRSVG